MTEEPVKIEFQRYAPGIFVARLWGIMHAEKYQVAIQQRMAFIDQYDDQKYVMIYDLSEVIYLSRPTVEAGKKIASQDPRALSFIVIGGPRLVRTLAIIVNKFSNKFHFADTYDQAIQLAENLLAQNA